MWDHVRELVTFNVFRVDTESSVDYLESLWEISSTTHAEAQSISEEFAGQPAPSQRRPAGRRERFRSRPGDQGGRADPELRREGRAERPLPLRQREEVQEVPRGECVGHGPVANACGRGSLPYIQRGRLDAADRMHDRFLRQHRRHPSGSRAPPGGLHDGLLRQAIRMSSDLPPKEAAGALKEFGLNADLQEAPDPAPAVRALVLLGIVALFVAAMFFPAVTFARPASRTESCQPGGCCSPGGRWFRPCFSANCGPWAGWRM